MTYFINLRALITYYFNILSPLKPVLLPLRFRCKDVRVAHFEIPSPKYFTPFSPILLPYRPRTKEVRVTHFEIPSPK